VPTSLPSGWAVSTPPLRSWHAWPSLRKAFERHGLGMPARNPEAVRWRAAPLPASAPAAGGASAGRGVRGSQPGRAPFRRDPQAEQGLRLRRAEEILTLSYQTVVELN
jgi:hypothetical protein